MYSINFKHIKNIVWLAIPIIISNLSRVFMELADMAMIGGIDNLYKNAPSSIGPITIDGNLFPYSLTPILHDVGISGSNALAGIGFSAMLLWILFGMGISLRTSTQTITSRRFGEKKYSGCGQALQNGNLIALIFL